MKLPAIFNRVSDQEKLFFTKRLSVMMKAGIPLSEALTTLSDQTKSPAFKKIILDLEHEVQNGQPLNKALKKYPEVFDVLYTGLIGLSEESGTLDENLIFLSEQIAKNFNLKNKIKSALLYPGLIISVTIILGGFISIFILPKLTDFFSAFNIKLPLSTQILLWFANLMKNYGFLIFGGIFILALIVAALAQLPPIKFFWHKIQLRLLFFGKIIQYGQLARFSRNLGMLIKSGVPISQALDVTAGTLSNLKYRSDLLEIKHSLAKGKEIGITMAGRNFFEYPALVSRMIAVGEKTGKLDETLLYLADYFEEEIDNIMKNLTTILEPILLVFIGLVVGFVALAIISPIYDLTGSIGQQ